MISYICSLPFKFHFLQHIGNNNPNIPGSIVPTAETDCFLCFSATDPIDLVGFWSAPLSSDDSSFRRESSDKFRKISTRNSLEVDGTDGN